MKSFLLSAIALAFLAMPALAQAASAQIGKPAPDFKLMDTHGNPQSISQYKGRPVVLEWNNPDCPYVGKHYGSGNMQALQKEATGNGVIWLTVNSGAPGKEGFQTADDANKWMSDKKASPTASLLDPSGDIGHLYGAKTTPHMFVIDKTGTLVYMGALDDNDSFKPETITGAKNYVREALKSLNIGKSVDVASTRPYGCSVKYAN